MRGHKLQAVLFDFDGTLVQTEDIGPSIFSSVLTARGQKPYEHLKRFRAVWQRTDTSETLEEVFTSALGELQSAQAIIEFRQKFLVDSLSAPETFGASQLLATLHTRKVKMALVSHARTADLMPQLDARGWTQYFTAVIPFEEFIAPKPDPTCYRQALKRLKVHSHKALIIEDSAVGLAAAEQAGITAIHIGCEVPGSCNAGRAVMHTGTLEDTHAFFTAP